MDPLVIGLVFAGIALVILIYMLHCGIQMCKNMNAAEESGRPESAGMMSFNFPF